MCICIPYAADSHSSIPVQLSQVCKRNLYIRPTKEVSYKAPLRRPSAFRVSGGSEGHPQHDTLHQCKGIQALDTTSS